MHIILLECMLNNRNLSGKIKMYKSSSIDGVVTAVPSKSKYVSSTLHIEIIIKIQDIRSFLNIKY